MGGKRKYLLAAVVATLPAGLVLSNLSVFAAPRGAAAVPEPPFPICTKKVGGTPAGVTGPSADGYALNVGALGTVYQPADNSYATVPQPYAFDSGTAAAPTRTVDAVFGRNEDVPQAPTLLGSVTSTDGGSTFPASTYDEDLAPSGETVRLRNGDLFSVAFKATSVTSTEATVPVYRSTDDGASWTTSSMTLFPAEGKLLSGLRTNEQPIELADGTIVLSAYIAYQGDPGFSAVLVQSTDGGATFTPRGVIAAATPTMVYNEAGIERLPDGSFLAVIRGDDPRQDKGEPVADLVTTSSPDGVTWSKPVPLKVSLNGKPASNYPGILPQLLRLPNGVMMLSSGRDNTGGGNNWAAISTNGKGTDWKGVFTYRNCPVNPNSNHSAYHGSSGNTGLAGIASNRVLQVGDNCHTWSCPPADENFTVDDRFRIWSRQLDVLTPDTGKLDLASLYAKDKISVTGSMDWSSADHPRAGVAGAFDGSTEYWSSAVSDGPGTVTVELDRTHDLTRIGLSLRNNLPESARVYASTDGQSWGEPIATATDRTDLSLRYHDFDTPVPARFVKVEVDATDDCDDGLGASCAFLNELELYSTTDSFENDPLNNRPRGYTDLAQTWVSQSVPGTSRHALLFDDKSTTQAAKATYRNGDGTSRTLSFSVFPRSFAEKGSILFDLIGTNASGDRVTPYHLAVFPDGSVQQWDGAAWQPIAPAATVQTGQWGTVTLTGDTSTASLEVNGIVIADDITATPGATSLTGHVFSSGGIAPSGDVFAIDDVQSR